MTFYSKTPTLQEFSQEVERSGRLMMETCGRSDIAELLPPFVYTKGFVSVSTLTIKQGVSVCPFKIRANAFVDVELHKTLRRDWIILADYANRIMAVPRITVMNRTGYEYALSQNAIFAFRDPFHGYDGFLVSINELRITSSGKCLLRPEEIQRNFDCWK